MEPSKLTEQIVEFYNNLTNAKTEIVNSVFPQEMSQLFWCVLCGSD